MVDSPSTKVTHSFTMTIRAGVERVFPMLCPVREHDYLDDWTAEILHSESGVAEEGCLFQTPNADGPPSTWYIVEHDPRAGRIVFVTFTPNSRVSRLDLLIEARSAAETNVTFTYTHTAIGPAGRDFIAAFTEDVFSKKMIAFERKLNEHLASG